MPEVRATIVWPGAISIAFIVIGTVWWYAEGRGVEKYKLLDHDTKINKIIQAWPGDQFFREPRFSLAQGELLGQQLAALQAIIKQQNDIIRTIEQEVLKNGLRVGQLQRDLLYKIELFNEELDTHEHNETEKRVGTLETLIRHSSP